MTGDRAASESIARPWLRSYDEGVPRSIEYPRTTLDACLEETAARYPDRAAIIFMGGKTTYRTLHGSVSGGNM